jgi:UDP-N-acetylmuramoylalanine-D-glutamate ligase
MKKTQQGFDSAENEDQDRFDKEQLSLSNDDLEKQTSALADLFRKKQAENAMKQQAILDQPSGKPTDPILKHLQSRGVQVTQEMYLAYAHPEGMDAETEAMLPEEFHDLPKK